MKSKEGCQQSGHWRHCSLRGLGTYRSTQTIEPELASERQTSRKTRLPKFLNLYLLDNHAFQVLDQKTLLYQAKYLNLHTSKGEITKHTPNPCYRSAGQSEPDRNTMIQTPQGAGKNSFRMLGDLPFSPPFFSSQPPLKAGTEVNSGTHACPCQGLWLNSIFPAVSELDKVVFQ